MKILFQLCFSVFLLSIGLNTALAYKFNNIEAEIFANHIHRSLDKLYKGNLDLNISELRVEFYHLPKNDENDLDDIIEAEHLLLHLQDQILRASVKYVWIYPEKYLALIKNLRESKILISAENFKHLLKNYPKNKTSIEDRLMKDALKELILAQGNPGLIPIGREFGIKINLHSQEKYFFGELPTSEDISDLYEDEFDDLDYELELDDDQREPRWFNSYTENSYKLNANQDGVIFRDTYLKSGDVLGVFTSDLDSGLFSAFALPKKYIAHVAIFIMLKTKYGPRPVIVEESNEGVSVIPLRYFFSAKKSRLISIYRFNREYAYDYKQVLSHLTYSLLGHPKGYNFLGPAGYPKNVTCIELIKYIYEKLGIYSLNNFGRWRSQTAKQNFESLNLYVESFLVPTSLALNTNFTQVDIIDNGEFSKLLVSEFITDEMGEIASAHKLKDEVNLQDSFFPGVINYLQTAIISEMQKGTAFFSSLFYFLSGMKKEYFPNGSPKLINFIGVLCDASGDISKKSQNQFLETIDQKIDQRMFSYWDLRQNKKINKMLSELMTSYRAGFED